MHLQNDPYKTYLLITFQVRQGATKLPCIFTPYGITTSRFWSWWGFGKAKNFFPLASPATYSLGDARMKTGSQNFLCTGHLNWRTCGISSSLSPTRQENAGLPPHVITDWVRSTLKNSSWVFNGLNLWLWGLLKHDTNLDEKWCQENALNKTFYNYAHYQRENSIKRLLPKKGQVSYSV